MIQNILALDLGTTTLGMAISRSGMFITPLSNLHFKPLDYDDCEKQLLETLKLEKVEHIVIGLPRYPSGDPAEMTGRVLEFIERLKKLFPNVDINTIDESNSTLEASEMLHKNKKNAKKQRSIIDSAAAMIILERYLKQIGQY